MPLIVACSAARRFCIDGSFSNLAPYTVESYGVRLGARSSGLGQTANGVGKILGPLSLALIAGTSNIVSPKATEGALFPAFLFLALRHAAGRRCPSPFSARETHGRPMSLGEDEPAARRPVVLGAGTR